MSRPATKNTAIISCFYLFLFIANGAMMPLFSLYLHDLKFSGTKIGIIISISPLMMLLVQPMWGYLCDTTKRSKFILVFTILITAGIGLFFPILKGFTAFFLLSILLALFQGAIEPVSTSLVISYTDKQHLSYGNFRLWGSIGFAISVWGLGQLSQTYSLKIIFYTFSLFLLFAAFFAWKLPNYLTTKKKMESHGIKALLTQSHFIIFLFASFLINGVMLAHNTYYGLLFQSIGGTIAGVGVSFLISVGSEVPFMRAAGKLIQHLGLTPILILVSFIAGVQFLCFYFGPTEHWAYILNIVKGFSTGIFIPASIQYVQENTPNSIQTTAVGIYSGIGFGLGNWFFTLIGGIILEYTNIFDVYLLYSMVSFIGMLLFIGLRIAQRKSSTRFSYD